VKVTNPRVIFPTVGRVFNVTPILDADFDGVRDSDDCAPLDNTLKTPAGPVTNIVLTDMGGATQVAWDSQEASAGTATSYDVVTGLVGDLRLDAGYASAVCGASLAPDSPFADAVVRDAYESTAQEEQLAQNLFFLPFLIPQFQFIARLKNSQAERAQQQRVTFS